jgi:uncharacterized membrane protein YraQ (UPF0718 family)
MRAVRSPGKPAVRQAPPTRPRRPLPAPDARLVALLLAVALGSRGLLGGALDNPAVRTWATVFVAITVQALPFLALGVLVSGAIAALLSPARLARLLPSSTLLAVPAAAVAGTALPGCECASVPIAGRLAARGVPAEGALAFMLASPAINPVVLAATAVAFPGQPRMVLARFLGSLLTAITVGLVWSRLGRAVPLAAVSSRLGLGLGDQRPAWQRLTAAVRHDLFLAGGWLVVGASAAATLQVIVPRTALLAVAQRPALAAPALGALAVLLAICSEADAFVAASLWEFSLTARLVFLVVGPAVDVKLAAMQAGVFGRRFAARFAPLTFAVAVAAALLVGRAVL